MELETNKKMKKEKKQQQISLELKEKIQVFDDNIQIENDTSKLETLKVKFLYYSIFYNYY